MRVRSATDEYGVTEERYEYDAFGKPCKGELGAGMNLGYTGKPYDPVTGLYNYGYRDYQPETARFTTADPVRDGANWFAYVNNDPVNWVDPWGLTPNTFQNGESLITGEGKFPNSSTGYKIQIFEHPISKLNVAVSVETVGDFMPAFNQTTTYTYQRDGKESRQISDTVNDPTDGYGSIPPSTSSGKMLGQMQGINLPSDINAENITNVNVSITLTKTGETVAHDFALTSPQASSNNKKGGGCND